MTEAQQPVIAIGDKIKVSWPMEDGSVEDVKGKVVQIEKTDKKKNGSYFKYTLQLKKSGESRTTRLVHLNWERSRSSTSKHDSKKRKHKQANVDDHDHDDDADNGITVTNITPPCRQPNSSSGSEVRVQPNGKRWVIPSHERVLAPMVGGSELAFRLLCRKYGADLAYTPMMNSERFAVDELYRKDEFQSVPEDRPLVAHFSGNNPDTMLAAAKLVENHCDAIDLNLGCPQRIAHAGHFGSYLLDEADRPIILSIVRTLADNISVPVFVKIRLLNTLAETIELVKQLSDAGAALVAVHGRHRVNLVGRTGPGARDGPAHLDQIAEIKKALPHVTIIANGNVCTYEDVVQNRKLTGSDGIMSAEGLLDDPALFVRKSDPASGEEEEGKGKEEDSQPKSKKAKKKSSDIDDTSGSGSSGSSGCISSRDRAAAVMPVPPDKLTLAVEYLDLVEKYPVKMKSIIFHIRRILKNELASYQLMEDCVQAKTPDEVRAVVSQAVGYRDRGDYVYDPFKEKRAKEALERRKRDEGKRKEYEARMMRKSKREGKPPDFYLAIGADCPSVEELAELRIMVKDKAFEVWKAKFSQHCFAFHLDPNGCVRERTCCFLHADASYSEAVAYG